MPQRVGDQQQVATAWPDYQRGRGRGPTEEKDDAFQLLRETCHDIRQPVAGVLALAGAALAGPDLPEGARRYLEQIVTQAQSLSDVIRQRLFASASAEAQARLTDLRQLADEAATAERVTYGGDLEVVPNAEPVLVCVNQLDVRGIISNLLSNATRVAGPAGSVKLEISHDPGLARLVVENTGPGFGNVPGGPGLGSRIMAMRLARCGGKISYGQSALGGVCASFCLPLTLT